MTRLDLGIKLISQRERSTSACYLKSARNLQETYHTGDRVLTEERRPTTPQLATRTFGMVSSYASDFSTFEDR
jgi:hypothetical protein